MRLTSQVEYPPTILPVVEKLKKDLRNAAKAVGPVEAKFLVTQYYQIQEYRKALNMQANESFDSATPSGLIDWLAEQQRVLETEIQKALKSYADNQPAGVWAQSIVGIGPVISAGLLAHIDPFRFNYIGSVMRLGGYDPTAEWKKGSIRPWNADLKVLFWKIGESFVKVSNHDSDIYGKVYKKWKDLYAFRNERGDYAELAKKIITEKNFDKTTDAYKAYSDGKLPPAHIHARAKRKAAHLFIAHFLQVYYESTHGKPLPRPWVFEYGGHDESSFLAPPGYTPLPRNGDEAPVNVIERKAPQLVPKKKKKA